MSAFLTTLGDTVKGEGVVIGILMLLVGLSGVGGAAGLFGGPMLGAICGGLFFLCGIVIAAQGQLLRASLDNAVCGSRFMSDSERLAAMGIPESTFAARQPVYPVRVVCSTSVVGARCAGAEAPAYAAGAGAPPEIKFRPTSGRAGTKSRSTTDIVDC